MASPHSFIVSDSLILLWWIRCILAHLILQFQEIKCIHTELNVDRENVDSARQLGQDLRYRVVCEASNARDVTRDILSDCPQCPYTMLEVFRPGSRTRGADAAAAANAGAVVAERTWHDT